MSRFSRRSFIALGLAAPAVLSISRPAMAKEPEIYAEGGIAIDGADPVAFFAEQGPVLGQEGQSRDWRGAAWRFATPENAAAFAADPERYAPQFGGYCAFAASRGYLAPTTPEAWTVYKGQLFLNANLRARKLWLDDLDANIAKGRANWPGILG